MELVSILYIVLIAAIIILTVLLSFVLVYVLFILRDVNKITETTKDTAEKINSFVIQPIKFTKEMVRYVKPLVEVVEKKAKTTSAAAKKKTTKKKKSS